jgi:hypothetical protein
VLQLDFGPGLPATQGGRTFEEELNDLPDQRKPLDRLTGYGQSTPPVPPEDRSIWKCIYRLLLVGVSMPSTEVDQQSRSATNSVA